MINNRMNVQNRGFSLIELLVVFAVVSILAATAVPSYNFLKERGYDATTQVDYRNLKLQVQGENDDLPSFIMFNQTESLAPPLDFINISPGVRVNFAYNLDFFSFRFRAVDMTHDSGSKTYRFVEFNDDLREYVYTR